MKVYRLCRKEEIISILKNQNFDGVGQECIQDETINTHKYKNDKKYLHFFPKFDDLLYLNTTEGHYICTYDIPDSILDKTKGIGKYVDFIKFMNLVDIEEYAIETSSLDIKNILSVFRIEKFIDYEDFWFDRSLKGFIRPVYIQNKKSKSDDLEK
ncbi:MAG: hypothetical protein IKY15_01040 [Clostridia bacterium]|nr:hypothetical protein [Clostridia bacterium]